MTDKKDFFKKSALLSILFILFSFNLNAQKYSIAYYGVVSQETDANMTKMVSNLYNTQLSEITDFSSTDMRTSPSLESRPDISELSSTSLSFYVVISKEIKADNWTATYFIIDKSKNEEHSKKKTYDSFYKILKETKDVLKETIHQLIESDASSIDSPLVLDDTASSPTDSIISTEELSGTWKGEDSINKIVILRGGRGFVIFKNGISMNISVELSGNNNKNVIITQKGRANASFFPELNRTTALNAAVTADPIKWTFSFIDSNTLSGIKETLLPDGDSYKKGNVKVNWSRIN